MKDQHSNYSALQDPPSPSGRLGDRIDRLRQRCIEALGKFAFNEAYTFLKQHEEVCLCILRIINVHCHFLF